jgi:choline-sulfatase
MLSRRSVKMFAALLVAALVLGGWFLAHREDSAPDRPNVILISIDTCRADYLGCYNSDWTTTPNIDAFAGSATLFVNVASPAPMTMPSHVSMLTGKIPLAHGVHDNGQIVPAENEMLAEILAVEGYATAAHVSAPILARQFQIDQGFGLFNDSMEVDGQMLRELTADHTVDDAIEWLDDADSGKPFFLFVHVYDPHAPYEAPEPFASQFNDPYAGEVAFVDAQIGRLLEALKAEGVYESSVVIVVGDHGEMLGEHGEADHGYFIYESAIKVPLIIKHPGQQTGRRVEGIVGLVDLVPSICSLVGIDAPAEMAGRDISDRVGDVAPSETPRSLYIQSPYPQIVFDTNPLVGLVNDRWKLILTTNSELYDLVADPEERVNLIDTEPRRARLMRDELDTIVAEVTSKLTAATAANDAKTHEMLTSLGYVGSGMRQAGIQIDPGKADPKEMIATYGGLVEVTQLMIAEEMDKAMDAGVALADANPQVQAVQWVAAKLLFDNGRFEQALAPCDRLVSMDPENADSLEMKGKVCGRAGRYAEAAAVLERAIELNPGRTRSHRELGDARTMLGDYAGAARAYEATLALDGRDLLAMNNLACLYVDQLGQPAKALPLVDRAMEMSPGVPILKDTAGWALANVGRYDEALTLLTESAEAHSIPETRYHLGWTLEKLNRPAEARKQYETARELFGEDRDDPIYEKVIEALARVAAP